MVKCLKTKKKYLAHSKREQQNSRKTFIRITKFKHEVKGVS